MADHNVLGKQGEELAVAFLVKEGYEILARNYRFLKNEIDIIAKDGDMIIGVEVKTRSTPEFGDPHEFVKPKQIQALVKVMDYYIQEQDLDNEVRFDIVAIIKNKLGTKVELLKDAFYHF